MSLPTKDKKLIYHMTAISNLASIIKNGLCPRNNIHTSFEDIADREILQNRQSYKLEEYVPFHFFAKTPFAGSVQKTYSETSFLYLTLTRNFASSNNFEIVPCHPLSYQGKPLPYQEGYEKIDWNLIDLKDYKNHKCKEACMAECIIKDVISFENFQNIFVKNEDDKSNVLSILDKAGMNRNSIHINSNENMFVK